MNDLKVRIWHGDGYTMEDMKGKAVTIPHYEEYQFFIHRPIGRFGCD